MKVFLAGNTPMREKEEEVIIDLFSARLISYFAVIDDLSMKKVFQVWLDRRGFNDQENGNEKKG
jgi:hypothetical protein